MIIVHVTIWIKLHRWYMNSIFHSIFLFQMAPYMLQFIRLCFMDGIIMLWCIVYCGVSYYETLSLVNVFHDYIQSH